LFEQSADEILFHSTNFSVVEAFVQSLCTLSNLNEESTFVYSLDFLFYKWLPKFSFRVSYPAKPTAKRQQTENVANAFLTELLNHIKESDSLNIPKKFAEAPIIETENSRVYS